MKERRKRKTFLPVLFCTTREPLISSRFFSLLFLSSSCMLHIFRLYFSSSPPLLFFSRQKSRRPTGKPVKSEQEEGHSVNSSTRQLVKSQERYKTKLPMYGVIERIILQEENYMIQPRFSHQPPHKYTEAKNQQFRTSFRTRLPEV